MIRKRRLVIAVALCAVLSGGVLLSGAGGSQKNLSLAAARSEQPTGGKPHSARLLPARRRVIAGRRRAVLRHVRLHHQIRPFKALHGPVGTKSQALRMAAASLAAYVSPTADARDASAASVSAEPTPSESASGGLHTVYEGSNVSAGLLPTDQGLCFVEVVSGTISSICTTNPVVSSGLGLLLHTAGEYQLVGVLPEGASTLTVEEASGATIEVPLDTEDGYAVTTKVAPITMRVTNSNSSAYSVPLNGPKTLPEAVQSPATPGG